MLTSNTISPALLKDSNALPSAVKAQPAAMPACNRRPHSGCSAPLPADHMRTCRQISHRHVTADMQEVRHAPSKLNGTRKLTLQLPSMERDGGCDPGPQLLPSLTSKQ